MAEFELSEMPKDKFLDFVKGLQAPPTDTAQALPESVTPEMQGTLVRSQQAVQSMQDVELSDAAKRMGVRKGAFLDIQTGAPASTRFKMGLDENQLNQFKMLTEQYGAGNVDLSDDGRFIIRGQKEDVMVDPIGLEKGDAAQMGAQAVPIIAGTLAARLGLRAKSGIGKVALGTLAASGAAAVAGSGQDVFVRWLNDNEKDLPEIGLRRAKQAVADGVLGMIAAGGLKIGTKAVEGALGIVQIPVGSTATKESAKKLFEQTGVKYPLTPGQMAESPFLLKVENVAGGRVGSSSAFDQIKAAQQKAEDELRRVFHGLPRTMTDDELMAALPRRDIVGEKALTHLGKESARVEGAVSSATDDILKTGTAEAQQIARVNLASPLVSSEVGKVARGRVVREFSELHDTMGQRYEDFLSKPEISSRAVLGDDLSKAAAEVEKKFVPAAERVVTKEVKGVDAYGGPTSKTRLEQKVESLDDFVPAKFRGFLDTLKGLKGAKVSVNTLKQIRTSIDNSIKEGISIPGTDVAQLRALKTSVEDGITSALQGMDDPSLLKTWNGLRSDYSKGMSRFDKVGVREMLVTEGERGSIGDTALAEGFIGNTASAADRYNTLKEFFGASSPEFEAMKQVARERTLKGSLSDSTGYIDGNRIRHQLGNLRTEIAEELFGVDKQELHRIGEVLSRAQGKLDTDEIIKLAQSKSLTAQKVAALQDAEMARTKAYNNKLIRAAAKGAIGEETIVPSEFVRHALAMDPAQAQTVVSALSDAPELMRDVRQLAVEDLWSKIRVGRFGQEKLSATALDDAMGDSTKQATWRAILGDDTVDSMRTLLKTISVKERDVSNFSGKLAGQSDIAQLALGGEVGAIKEASSRFLLGFMYSGPMRRLFTNLYTTNDRSRMLNAVISSQPFIGELIDRFGSDGAFSAMASLREFVEPIQKKELFIQGEIQDFDLSQLSKDEFKQWLSNTAGSLNPETIQKQTQTR